jgi:hypothetical protein
MSDATCSKCKYWHTHRSERWPQGARVIKTVNEGETETVEMGECRRYAPHPTFGGTREDDWCAEFQPTQ